MANVVFPNLSLSMIGLTVFLIPPSQNGAFNGDFFSDRLTLLITVILTSVAFALSVAGSLPSLPYMTYMDKWVNLLFLLFVLCGIEATYIQLIVSFDEAIVDDVWFIDKVCPHTLYMTSPHILRFLRSQCSLAFSVAYMLLITWYYMLWPFLSTWSKWKSKPPKAPQEQSNPALINHADYSSGYGGAHFEPIQALMTASMSGYRSNLAGYGAIVDKSGANAPVMAGSMGISVTP